MREKFLLLLLTAGCATSQQQQVGKFSKPIGKNWGLERSRMKMQSSMMHLSDDGEVALVNVYCVIGVSFCILTKWLLSKILIGKEKPL